jgi:hypothetical protein
MGWHRFGDHEQGITGDDPIDIMATAVDRIAAVYSERFGRPPMLAELLHALRVVLEPRSDELLFDPERLASHPPSAPLPAVAPLDLDAFEAAWGERPAPDGAYYVSERATGQDVLRCSLRVEHRTLFADYEVLRPGLGSDDLDRLILHNLIRQLVRDEYADDVDQVSIAAVGSAANRTLHAFPGRAS